MINIREFLGLGYYTSNLDEFIAEFNKKHHKLSVSQRLEIEMHAGIRALRDNATDTAHDHSTHSKLWNKF